MPASSGLPKDACELFVEGNELENTRILNAEITGNRLRLDLADDRNGTFCIVITAQGNLDFIPMKVEYDEPIGAGADPYNRPDPRTHPEAWTE